MYNNRCYVTRNAGGDNYHHHCIQELIEHRIGTDQHNQQVLIMQLFDAILQNMPYYQHQNIINDVFGYDVTIKR